MQLNYKTFGAGEPLLILHGLFGMLDNWQTIGKKLSEHFTVFLLDHRNHGRSPHAADMNYKIFAEDLREFMDEHHIFKSHLLGHSMGGKTVMEFALEYPDSVDKLTVVDIAPKQYPDRHSHIFQALQSLDLKHIDSRKEAEELLDAKIAEKDEVLFLLKNLSRNKEGGFRLKMNLQAISNHYEDILAAVNGNEPFDGETLFLRGAQSNHILKEDEPEIKRLFPNASIETIEGAGHWIHADQPEAFTKKIMEFLQ